MLKLKISTWVAFGISWVVAAILSGWAFSLQLAGAILGGFGIALLHWVALLVHHMGHALAARTTGYPMTGVLLWGWLGTSLYPREEPELPPSVHLRRAMGGPISSTLIGFAAAMAALVLYPLEGNLWIFPAFLALDSLLIFGLGSLIPLGFNDGSTLLHWLRR